MQCDRCKVELEGDFYVLSSVQMKETKPKMYTLGARNSWKLCPRCYSLVSKIVELGLDTCLLYASTSKGESID